MTQILTPAATLPPLGDGVNDVDGAGTVITDVDCEWVGEPNIIALIVNGSVGVITATLKSQVDSNGRGGPTDTDNDKPLVIAAGDFAFIPFTQADGYNNSSGNVKLLFDGVDAALKVALYRLQR